MVPTQNVNKLTVLLVVFSLFISCSKDTDLLDDYAATENVDIQEGRNFIKDDVYTTDGNSSIILDVLSNDSFPDIDKVRIVRITNPSLGIVEITENKTIIYTPVGADNDATSNTGNNESNEETGDTSGQDTTDTPENGGGTEENSPEGNSSETNQEGSETTETGQSTGEEETTDTFNYTAETTNNDGTTTTEEGSVTVEYTNEETSSEEETAQEEETQEEESQPNPNIADNARYVTVNGRGSNDGLTENTAWSIEHAFNVAQPGQTIYIKAGNYGNKQLILYRGGNSGSPIRFIGYRSTPEDIQSSNGSTFDYGDQLDASRMPLFQGDAPQGRGQGRTFRIDGNYVEFSNIQFTRYDTAILNQGSNCVYKNIVGMALGDFSSGGSSSYSGTGIVLEGSNNSIQDSYFYNLGAEGVSLKGCNTCQVRYTEVASDSNTNPTDYYILLTSGTTNSVVDNCLARRKSGLSHFGHGLVMKDGAYNNTITRSEAINTYIELQFSNVYENLVTNCTISGSRQQDNDYAGGIMTANGAHHNTFRDIEITGVYSGLRFSDWDDNAQGNNDANDAGNNNTYENIRVFNSEFAIDFNEFQKLEGPAWNNEFKNCYFRDVDILFRVNRPNSNNKLSGCTVQNVGQFQVTSAGYNYQLNSNTTFENMNWVNIGFTAPN